MRTALGTFRGRAATIALATTLVAHTGVSQEVSSGKRVGGDWGAVDEALGRKGTPQPGDVMRYSFPRGDLTVTANGVELRPAFALGSWIAFKRIGGGHAMMMGDLVLMENEIAPVMRALQEGGVEETALHNHVLGESPRIMYMHVSGHADPVKLAQAIRRALGQTGTPMAAPTPAAPPAVDIDTAAVTNALGYPGHANGGVWQVSVPRRETIRDAGREVPPSMGVATAINFQPTGGGKAAITGDFVMTAGEVNKVIRALQQNGITVTALHSHMLTETPRLFFMHFWANDDAPMLARGLRAALDQMAVKAPAKTASR